MTSGTIWIVSPSFFDVESFIVLRDRLREVVPATIDCREVRFVVFDDSAGDDPDMSSLASDPDVRVVTPPFNLGHQRGLVYALRLLLADIKDDDVVVTMDADGEDRPEDVPSLVSALAEDAQARLVLAHRTARQESNAFRLFYGVFKVAFRILTGTVLVSGNFAAFTAPWARRALLHPAFDLAYSSTLVAVGKPVLVSTTRGGRYAGRSRMSFSRLVMHGIRLLMPFLDRIAVRSLVAFAATLGACILGAMVIVSVRLFTDSAIPGWATYTLLMVLVLSVVSLGNFVVLFAVFSQSQGISLADVERHSSWAGWSGTGRARDDIADRRLSGGGMSSRPE